MRETLYGLLNDASSTVGIVEIAERLLLAIVLALILFLTYKLSFSSINYNKKFNISLIMITLVTTAVMMVIGSSISLSLGMVGALSIVRFRTAIKDPRDAAYIFWAITIGLCAGTGNYILGIGTTLIISMVLIVSGIGVDLKTDKYVVVIRGNRSEEDNMMREINKSFKVYLLKSKHTTDKKIELVYQVKMKNSDDRGFVDRLYKIHGIDSVNILAQSGETVG